MLLSFRCSDYFFPYYRISQSETKGPHDIHSLRSSCFIKTSAFNVAGNLVMVVKFTFQSVFGNSRQNPRHFSARGREESLWSDWPTSKQQILRHGNRFAARVRRRYFSEGEKGRPEMRLLFAGYVKACSRFYACISSLLIKPELHGEIRSYRRESTFFWLLNQISVDIIWRTSFHT